MSSASQHLQIFSTVVKNNYRFCTPGIIKASSERIACIGTMFPGVCMAFTTMDGKAVIFCCTCGFHLSDIAVLINDEIMTSMRFLHYWPFVRGIYRSPADSLYKWVGNAEFDVFFVVEPEQEAEQTVEAGDLRCYGARATWYISLIPFE